MKRILYLLLLSACSCSKPQIQEKSDVPSGSEVTFEVSLDVPTKTSLGQKTGDFYPVLWSEGDCISVNGRGSSALTDDQAGKSVATFKVTQVSAPYKIVYPVTAMFSDGVILPKSQKFTEWGFDPATARDDLSIQVHPDDAMAQAVHGQPFGKTEMWYVVSADKDAHLMSGLSAEITPEEYVSRVENNTITDVLCDYRVQSGDVFFLPAGRIHSIGKGCFIAEIQQTSDLTYRIYDFGRLGLDGKPRELHTELAKNAIDYSVSEDYRTAYAPVLNEDAPLVECEYFKTNLLDLTESLSVDVKSKDSFMIVICLEGQGELTDSEGNVVAIKQGETVLVPASTDSIIFKPHGQMKILTSSL